MTTLSASPATTPVRPSGRTRAARIGMWTTSVLLSAQFVLGGVLKLTADPRMVVMFADVGAGQRLRLLVGVCELAGGIGVLVPRLARPAATGLAVLLGCAAVTNVVVLHTSPALPLVLLAMAVLVVAARTRKGIGR